MTANPRTRAQQKTYDVLDIVGKFGFASPGNITLASGAKMRGYGERLHEIGLLTKREVSGLVVEGKAVTKIFGLSRKGADLAGVEPVDIWKVSAARMAHTLIAQRIVIESFRGNGIPFSGIALDYTVEPQGPGIHFRPDVMLLCQHLADEDAFFGVYIEVELSGKSGGELDRFFAKLDSLRCVVHFESPQLMHRYLRKMEEYVIKNELPKWYRRADGIFIPDGVMQFCELNFRHVYFQTRSESHNLDSLILWHSI